MTDCPSFYARSALFTLTRAKASGLEFDIPLISQTCDRRDDRHVGGIGLAQQRQERNRHEVDTCNPTISYVFLLP